MTRKNVPESEQKLLILLALRCLGGVTQLQLLRFMVEEDVMNYFVLQLNLCELEEMGQVRVCHHALGSLYELTEQGRYTLDSFDSHIPASRRQALEAGRCALESTVPGGTAEPGGRHSHEGRTGNACACVCWRGTAHCWICP